MEKISVNTKNSLITIKPFTLSNKYFPETTIDLASLQKDNPTIIRIYANPMKGTVNTECDKNNWHIGEIDLPKKTYHEVKSLDDQGKEIILLEPDDLDASSLTIRLFEI